MKIQHTINHINIFCFLFIGAIAITDGRYGKGVGPVHMSSVRCDGHEMRLKNCTHSNGVGVTNCHHGIDAGVLCEGTIPRPTIVTSYTCYQQKLQLTMMCLSRHHKNHIPLVVRTLYTVMCLLGHTYQSPISGEPLLLESSYQILVQSHLMLL